MAKELSKYRLSRETFPFKEMKWSQADSMEATYEVLDSAQRGSFGLLLLLVVVNLDSGCKVSFIFVAMYVGKNWS